MIRNKENAVREIDGALYVRIPNSIAEKSQLKDGFSITYVAGTKSIEKFVEKHDPQGDYQFGADGNIGSILLTF